MTSPATRTRRARTAAEPGAGDDNNLAEIQGLRAHQDPGRQRNHRTIEAHDIPKINNYCM